jgi:hypothetical protein
MITKNTPLRDCIRKVDPDRKNIPAKVTVGQLRDRMQAGEAYYDICPVDSIVREQHFQAIEEATGVDYDTIYDTWVHQDDQEEGETISYSQLADILADKLNSLAAKDR